MITQVAIDGYDDNFSYFVGDEREVMVVDPGDVGRLLALVEEKGWELKGILITHSHHDHVGGVEELVGKFGLPVYMHRQADGRVPGVRELNLLEDGDVLRIGGVELEVLHTPGHIDDAVCYYDRAGGELITGDTLFVEGCGRADLRGSNVEDLWRSLQRLKQLPEDVMIYPGHDYGSSPVSSIGHEKAHNKYLLCADFEEFRKLRLA